MRSKGLQIHNFKVRYLKFVPHRTQEKFVQSVLDDVVSYFKLTTKANFSILKTGDFYKGVLEIFDEKKVLSTTQVDLNLQDLCFQLRSDILNQVADHRKGEFSIFFSREKKLRPIPSISR